MRSQQSITQPILRQIKAITRSALNATIRCTIQAKFLATKQVSRDTLDGYDLQMATRSRSRLWKRASSTHQQ